MAAKKSKKQPQTPKQPVEQLSSDLVYYQKHLNVLYSVIVTVAIALETENAEHGGEFATTLRRCVLDPLWGLIEKMGPLDDI